MKQTKASLTSGNVRTSMILFSLPMIAGNLLQQLYNIVDTLIVGRFLGVIPLSAVGTSYPLMVLLTSIVLGLCMGSGVVCSIFYGSSETDDLKSSIFNSFVFIAIITIILNVSVVLLLDPLLVWMKVPAEALEDTRLYLSIIFLGIGFTSLYNFCATVVRSIGNSVAPLIFLAIASVLNIVLDIFFISGLHMGVDGAAWATILSQAVSAIGMLLYLIFKKPELLPKRQHCRLNRSILKRIIQNSVLTSIQQSIMNLGILMIQGLVNSFGVAAMAAFAAAVKIDSFAYMPAQDFGNAFSTFIAQNFGAKKHTRIHEGIRVASVLSFVFCLVVSGLVALFASPLLQIFIDGSETEILNIGVTYLRIEGVCYVGIGILFLLYGLYRGLEQAQMSIVLTVLSLGTRVVLAYLLAPTSLGLIGIWIAIPVGWFLADAVGIVYFFKIRHKLQHLEEADR